MKIKRIFDLLGSIFLSILFLIPMFLISIIIKLSSKGPALYFSKRIGRFGKVFLMPKYRTMILETPTTATHLLRHPEKYYTKFGRFLRRTSLDELPQLFSIIKGDMSLVGPRPALFNQYDLIQYRKRFEVDTLVPGVTGWAQINGRDEISIEEKVKFDVEYLSRMSMRFDLFIIWHTLLKVIKKDGISH